MEKIEVGVIGAGVIGLAVARSLAVGLGKEVLVLERAKTFGTETSSRNSEVVHGGLYYPTGTLKAKTCVEGRQLLYNYCRERNIFCEKLGKLVVATESEQMPKLRKLLQQSHRNGYESIRMISVEDVKVMEPCIRAGGGGALWSPETGIVDSHNLMLHLLGDAQDQGTLVAFNTEVEDARVVGGGGQSNGNTIQLLAGGIWLSCQYVINCAGLWASHVAEKFHPPSSSSPWTPPTQYFAKGNYFRLEAKSPFHHLIYPVPDEKRGGLGVHATLDSASCVRFGPDVEWLDPDIVTTPDQIDLKPNASREAEFYDSIRSYWPELPDGALSPDYVGVRPKLWHPQRNGKKNSTLAFYQDFYIAGPEQHGVKGLFHLLGLESPGLTSSLAIAEIVAHKVAEAKAQL
ncbi:hypothetical protein ACA910_014485 [Epithemia clementina (nom. ined.)]